MSRITIVPIVEGHTEVQSLYNLLWRTWTEIVGGEHVERVTPFRIQRDRFIKDDDDHLRKAVESAARLVPRTGQGMILILVDAEKDCAKIGPLGPMLLKRARQARSDMDIACVIANVMYETWFVAAAESLGEYLDISKEDIPDDPEGVGSGTGWIKAHMKNGRYKKTVDAPGLVTKMDLKLCRQRSKSYDKLCRELELRHRQTQNSKAPDGSA